MIKRGIPGASKRVSRLHSKDPADAAWRARQAQIDADIEGLSRDPEADRLMAEMDTSGVPPRQQIKRLKAYFRARGRRMEREKALSFEPLVPNRETIEAMKAAERGEVTTVGHPRKLLKSLNAAAPFPRRPPHP